MTSHTGPDAEAGAARPEDIRPRGPRAAVPPVDIALAGSVFLVVGVAIMADIGGGTGVGPSAYLFGAVFGVLVLARRRRPVAVLVLSAAALPVYYMLDHPPIGLALPVAVALFSAAAYGHPVWAAGTATALLTLSTAVRLAQGDDPGFVLGLELPASAALMAAVVALGDSLRSRRRWRAELAKQAHAAAAEREQRARERVAQERLRIARDLHDLLAHTVSVIAVHTDVARESLLDDPETAELSLTAARAACRSAGRELRATLDAMRGAGSGATAPHTGLAQLDELLDATRSTGLRVEIRGAPGLGPLPAVVDATVYRLVQESLSNVLRHAGAQHVTVEFAREPDGLRIRIHDDGCGTADGPGTGWGIMGMRERITLLGGSVRAGPEARGGFVVEAYLPLRERA